MKNLLTIREAAQILNCSEKTVRRLASEGHLKAAKIRNCLRVDAKNLETFIKQQIEAYQLKGELDGNF